MHLAIDIGNSRTKLALFQDGEMVKHASRDAEEAISLQDFLEGDRPQATALSSVRKELAPFLEENSLPIGELLVLSPDMPLPIDLQLGNTSSVGPDRLANAVAAQRLWPDRSILVIDMGTCITYDRIEGGALVGGAITPGVRMRADSMHRSTGRLPLVEMKGTPHRIEGTTEGSLQAGIYYGVLDEIKGQSEAFLKDRSEGVVLLTGGDASLVGKELKKGIFADPFLTLRGLDAILYLHMASGHFDGGHHSAR
ncbi:MAG: type III pantothenate kinase [Flavobacteriales bacterium]